MLLTVLLIRMQYLQIDRLIKFMSIHVRRCCGSESGETGHQSEGVIENRVGEENAMCLPMIERARICKRSRMNDRVQALPTVILFKMHSEVSSLPPYGTLSLFALFAVCCSNQTEELFCAAVWKWRPKPCQTHTATGHTL